MYPAPPPLPPPLKPAWLNVDRGKLQRLNARVYLLKNLQTNNLKGFDFSLFENRDKLLCGLGALLADSIDSFILSGLVRCLSLPAVPIIG